MLSRRNQSINGSVEHLSAAGSPVNHSTTASTGEWTLKSPWGVRGGELQSGSYDGAEDRRDSPTLEKLECGLRKPFQGRTLIFQPFIINHALLKLQSESNIPAAAKPQQHPIPRHPSWEEGV